MKSARAAAHALRSKPNVTPCDLTAAAAVIDTLIDVIESQRGPVTVPPAPELEPLRELRQWHAIARDTTGKALHAQAVTALNRYFPKGDQL